PQDAVAYLRRAYCYYQMGELERAIADCTTAINIDGDYEGAYVHRAICSSTTGQFGSAIADWSEAMRLDPSNAQSIYGRGMCYRQSGENLLAIEDFNEAIRLAPRALYYQSRALAYRNLGRIDEALRDERTAIEFG